MGTLKSQSNGPLYNNTVICALSVDGWAVNLVQRKGACAGWSPARSIPGYIKRNSPPINGQCTNFILFDVELHSKGLRLAGDLSVKTCDSTRSNEMRVETWSKLGPALGLKVSTVYHDAIIQTSMRRLYRSQSDISSRRRLLAIVLRRNIGSSASNSNKQRSVLWVDQICRRTVMISDLLLLCFCSSVCPDCSVTSCGRCSCYSISHWLNSFSAIHPSAGGNSYSWEPVNIVAVVRSVHLMATLYNEKNA